MKKSPKDFYIVIDFITYNDKTKPYVTLHNTKTGEIKKTKVKDGKIFSSNPFTLFSGLKIKNFCTTKKVKMY